VDLEVHHNQNCHKQQSEKHNYHYVYKLYMNLLLVFVLMKTKIERKIKHI
jgi:hypothetical protein